MTGPDTTVIDGTSTPTDETAAPVDSGALAAAGLLVGGDLANHLGASDLDAHAAAQVAQGVSDGQQAPDGFGPGPEDPHRDAVIAWLADPTYATAFNVPGGNGSSVTYVTCGLCGGVFGPHHDWHTEDHRRSGG